MPRFFLSRCRSNCGGEQARFNNMFRSMRCGSNESETHLMFKLLHQNGGRKNRDICPLRMVRKGSEISEPSNDGRMTVRGVVESLGNGKALRFG